MQAAQASGSYPVTGAPSQPWADRSGSGGRGLPGAHPAAGGMFLGTLFFFWKSVAGVLLGARCLFRGASPHTSLTTYHEDDARSDFSPALAIPGPRAGAAELFADQGHLSFTFTRTYIPLL